MSSLQSTATSMVEQAPQWKDYSREEVEDVLFKFLQKNEDKSFLPVSLFQDTGLAKDLKSPFKFSMALTRLAMTERIYHTCDFNWFSATQLDDNYQLFSNALNHNYGRKMIVNNERTGLVHNEPRVPLADLKKLLLSKDIEAADKFFDGTTRLLGDDKAEVLENIVYFASYPRCGNTWFAASFEELTSIAPGSDMGLDALTLTVGLMISGQVATQSHDEGQWLMKTHIPFDDCKFPIDIKKVVLVVRNPIQAIQSQMHLLSSWSHNLVIDTETIKENDLVKMTRENLKPFVDFHLEWIKAARERKCQIYFFRYEDMCDNLEKVLTEAFKFILEVDSLEGTVIEHNINKLLEGRKKIRIYKRASKEGDKVKVVQKEFLHSIPGTQEVLKFFGYMAENEDSPEVIFHRTHLTGDMPFNKLNAEQHAAFKNKEYESKPTFKSSDLKYIGRDPNVPNTMAEISRYIKMKERFV